MERVTTVASDISPGRSMSQVKQGMHNSIRMREWTRGRIKKLFINVTLSETCPATYESKELCIPRVWRTNSMIIFM